MPSQPLKNVTREGLRACLALPDRESRAGVIVLPAVSGIPGVTRVLGLLADAGFTALAWDPFSSYPEEPDPKEKTRHCDTVQQDALVLAEHRQWVGYMQDELGLARIGAMGFCMGGRMSLLLAAEDARIAAVAAWYPTLRDPKPALVADPVPLVPNIACPVLVQYPGKDALTSHASIGRLRSALEARSSGLTAFYFHPLASHGFYSRVDEKGHPDAEASALAWPATMAFLRAALMQGA